MDAAAEGLGGQGSPHVPDQVASVKPASTAKPVETVSERYLRHIRNVVVAAFIIWLAGAAIGGIVFAAVSAHDHTVQEQQACSNNGGFWANGQCL